MGIDFVLEVPETGSSLGLGLDLHFFTTQDPCYLTFSSGNVGEKRRGNKEGRDDHKKDSEKTRS